MLPSCTLHWSVPHCSVSLWSGSAMHTRNHLWLVPYLDATVSASRLTPNKRSSNAVVVGTPVMPVAQVRALLQERLVKICFSPFNFGDRISCGLQDHVMMVPSHGLWVGPGTLHKRTIADDSLAVTTLSVPVGLPLGPQWKQVFTLCVIPGLVTKINKQTNS